MQQDTCHTTLLRLRFFRHVCPPLEILKNMLNIKSDWMLEDAWSPGVEIEIEKKYLMISIHRSRGKYQKPEIFQRLERKKKTWTWRCDFWNLVCLLDQRAFEATNSRFKRWNGDARPVCTRLGTLDSESAEHRDKKVVAMVELKLHAKAAVSESRARHASTVAASTCGLHAAPLSVARSTVSIFRT